MTLIEYIRSMRRSNHLEGAIIDSAINKCIEKHVLENFLSENRSKVKEYLRIHVELLQLAEESYDEGVKNERMKCIDGLSETMGCSRDKSKELLRIN